MPRPATPVRGASWPFTGRGTELRMVAAALERDGAVVVAGPAGVGKSRLARELAARLSPDDPVAVATGSASARDIPLGAFAPWLAVPVDAGAPDPDAGVSALARVGTALRESGPRTLLLVDDAHVLDEVSATLVHQLALDRTVRLVLTVRAGERCPEAVTAIWKDGLAERVDLEPLAAAAGAALLRAVLGGRVDAQAQRRLHDTTRGNVLWLRHLVEGERAAGRLVAVDDRWEWHGPTVLPPALETLLAERIGTLDEDEAHVLELVALGEPIGLDMLAELVSEAAVERLAERGLVRAVEDGARSEVHLGHPLYGEVTRARMSLPRARRRRGELSRALRSTGGRRAGDDLRRAVLDLGSDSPPDSTLLVLAAEQAMNLTDFVLAERLLRAAVEADGGFEARLGLGFLLGWLMRAEEAEAELAAALPAATTRNERARALLARAHLLLFILDRADEARALLDREGVDASGTPFPEATALRGALLVCAGDVEPGLATVATVLAAPGVSPQATTWASWAAAYGTAFRGSGATSVRDHVTRGMEAARQAPETIAMLGNLGFGDVLEAGLRGSLDDARPRIDWVESLPGEHAATWSALYHGRLALEAGRVVTAAGLLDSILPSFPGHGGGWTAWFHAMIAQARAVAGDAPGASASLRAAEEARHPVIRAGDGDVDLARAWIAAVQGSLPDAVATARRLAGHTHAHGQRAMEMVARHTAVRLGDRDQAVALAELARILDTPRARAAALHGEGLTARDPDVLLAAADELEAAGLLLAAADAAAHAALAARDRGRLPVAGAAVDRALALATERCEGASTPAVALASAPLPVSSREREVAVLAAQGLTNRQIAARLHVSVRTVESHIYRACTRLGLPDRAALAAAVAPGRTTPSAPPAP